VAISGVRSRPGFALVAILEGDQSIQRVATSVEYWHQANPLAAAVVSRRSEFVVAHSSEPDRDLRLAAHEEWLRVRYWAVVPAQVPQCAVHLDAADLVDSRVGYQDFVAVPRGQLEGRLGGARQMSPRLIVAGEHRLLVVDQG
jgi:hypothetical protein